VRRALVVGIDDYPWAPLAGCVADATAIAGVLQSHADGSPNFACQLITAPHATIDRALLRERIEALFASPADIAMLYFSGHGTENNLGGYLVTPDARRYDEGMAMSEILTLANRSRVDEVVIVLDCCNSGALGQVPAIDNDRALLREGMTILAASRAAESAVEEDGRGLFTTLVCDALAGGASDPVGNVTVASVYAYVDQSLGAWEQRPLFKSHVSRLTPIRRNEPAVPLGILRQLQMWFPQADSVFPLDPSYEPEAEPRDADHELVFGYLQRCRAARLVEPVGEDHMYWAAMHSTGCLLTALGRHYWRLAAGGRI
jgi:uncharacterized caspase-like protein